MNNLQIGCGQITWKAKNRQLPEAQQISSNQILAEIAQAGYAGTPTGPSVEQSTDEILAKLDEQGLKPAPGYLSADFWNPAKEAEILEMAHAFAQFHQTAGVGELFVAPGGFYSYVTSRGLTRLQLAGHVRPEDQMTDVEFEQFAKALNQTGEITLSYGVRSCFHSHVGSTIETDEEIDHLFSLVNRNVVFMGPDTGHLLWGGVDVIEFCRRYADTIKTIHIKDVNKAVLEEGVAAKWDYLQFYDAGIWTELGTGCIDFPTLFTVLEQADFDGWMIVETDITQLATPFESAVISRNYLKRILG